VRRSTRVDPTNLTEAHASLTQSDVLPSNTGITHGHTMSAECSFANLDPPHLEAKRADACTRQRSHSQLRLHRRRETTPLDLGTSSDLMKINAMHNHGILQGTTHSDALHRDSMHENSMQAHPVRSDSDAAQANSGSY